MKKRLLTIALCILLTIIGLTLFVACNITEDDHTEHTFSTEWNSNETHHWHSCGGCSETIGYAPHDFSNGNCICGKEKPSISHEHDFSSEWTSDETYHWHIATCEHTDEISGKARHTFGEWMAVREPQGEVDGLEQRVCAECEYKEERAIHAHKFSTAWTSDETYHWRVATCEHADEIRDKALHKFVDRKCICGFEIGTSGLRYELNSDGESYCLKDMGTAFESNIVIVSTYNGKPVTSIGNSAFAGCNNLESVVIPNSVVEIGEKAFYDCTTLTDINIPDSVTTIGFSAFNYCNNLKSITLPFVGGMQNGNRNTHFGYIFGAESYKDNQNYIPTSLEQVTITNGTMIGYRAFYHCNSLTSVTIPDGVFSIGQEALEGCTSLTDIIIPMSVTNIGANAFKGCPIENITMPSLAIEYIGKSNLNTVIITNGASIADNTFSGCRNLTSITLPDSLISIGNSAFEGCGSLTSVTLPESLTSIGSSAFDSCSSLTSIAILDSVTSIGEKAFYDCPIENATIPTLAIGYIPKSKLKTVIITSGTSIGSSAFSGCSSLTSITIPDSVISIGERAFWGCSRLTDTYYNGDVVAWLSIDGLDDLIGYNDFGEPNILRNLYINGEKVTGDIVIPDSIIAISSYAFFGCSSLTSVTIPDSVTSIGSSAFFGCTSLTSVTIHDNTTSIGSSAFGFCFNLTNVTIGNSVTSIGSNAFEGCSSLTNIKIPNSVTSIGSNAFSNCSSLTSITIPDSVTSIGKYTFYACSSLTSVTIGNSVTSIGDSAFRNCIKLLEVYNLSLLNVVAGSEDNGYAGYYAKVIHTSLDEESIIDITQDGYMFIEGNGTNYLIGYNGTDTELILPDTYNGKSYAINDHAFEGCSSLTSVIIPDSVTSIGDSAFEYCYKLVEVYNLSSLNIVAGSFYNGKVGYYAKVIHTSLDEESKIGETEDGYIFVEDKDGNAYLVGYNGTDTELILPDTYNGKSYAINTGAFYNCTLTSITISDSVTSIGDYAFSRCSSLTSVTIGNSVTNIGSNAFAICFSLTSVTIPNSVTNIGEYAFFNCINLTSVTIGNSVTSIGAAAFYSCSQLNKVYYKGTSAEWREIGIDSDNSYLTNATRYYYSEEKPTDTTNKYWRYADDGVTIVEW